MSIHPQMAQRIRYKMKREGSYVVVLGMELLKIAVVPLGSTLVQVDEIIL
jgi:hypothetical protein